MNSIDQGFLEGLREGCGGSIQQGGNPVRLRHGGHSVQGFCGKQITGRGQFLHLRGQIHQMTLGCQAEKVLQLQAVHRGIQRLRHRIGHVSLKSGQGGKGGIGLVAGKGGHQRFGRFPATEDTGGADGRLSQFVRAPNAAQNKGKGALDFLQANPVEHIRPGLAGKGGIRFFQRFCQSLPIIFFRSGEGGIAVGTVTGPEGIHHQRRIRSRPFDDGLHGSAADTGIVVLQKAPGRLHGVLVAEVVQKDHIVRQRLALQILGRGLAADNAKSPGDGLLLVHLRILGPLKQVRFGLTEPPVGHGAAQERLVGSFRADQVHQRLIPAGKRRQRGNGHRSAIGIVHIKKVKADVGLLGQRI